MRPSQQTQQDCRRSAQACPAAFQEDCRRSAAIVLLFAQVPTASIEWKVVGHTCGVVVVAVVAVVVALAVVGAVVGGGAVVLGALVLGALVVSAASPDRSRQRAVMSYGWVFFFTSSAHLHARPIGRACRRAGEIELTPTGVRLNGPGRVPHLAHVFWQFSLAYCLYLEKGAARSHSGVGVCAFLL